MTPTDLLKARNEAKSRKPVFVVKESNNTARIKKRWRFPRGRHSKVRQMHRGRPALPHPGYGSPEKVRGLHKSGLEMVVVNNLSQISVLDSAKEGAVIASGVGAKKKLDLLRFAKEKSIIVFNVNNLGEMIEKITSSFEERKKAKKEGQAVATKKEEEKKKKAEEKAKKNAEEKTEQKKSGAEKAVAGKEKISENGSKEELDEREKQKEIIEKTITKRQ